MQTEGQEFNSNQVLYGESGQLEESVELTKQRSQLLAMKQLYN